MTDFQKYIKLLNDFGFSECNEPLYLIPVDGYLVLKSKTLVFLQGGTYFEFSKDGEFLTHGVEQ